MHPPATHDGGFWARQESTVHPEIPLPLWGTPSMKSLPVWGIPQGTRCWLGMRWFKGHQTADTKGHKYVKKLKGDVSL